MLKLIDDFTVHPCKPTAKKLLAYLQKHPMTACFLSERDLQTIERAKQFAS